MENKGKTPIKPVRTTVASVRKEMQKPRLTESVRNDGKRLAIPVAKRPTRRPCLIPSTNPQNGPHSEGSVVQNDVEKRLVNPDAAVVFNKAEFTKTIHEEADARPGGADHFGQSFLCDLRN